ncbi:MAG: LLM class flavin-dependent oxidoreductase [Chloroflexi bacterium]|nr:LLM class flavin-dependent oxidoreductase [Chloroflexota bacterium]
MTISIAFQTNKSPAEYTALAKLVNQYDFGVVSVYCDAPFHPSYGPLLLMAPHIERARLGPAAVSVSRMAPIDIAADTALLSQAAAGGAYVGIVRGAWLSDYGIREIEQPIQAIREAVEVIRYMLLGQTGGYIGEVYQLAPHVRAPYPPLAQPVPVMIGSWGPKLCAVAGEIADEVKVGGSANPDLVPVIQEYIAVGERRAGRTVGSVGVVIGAVTVADADRERARAQARRSVALYLPVIGGLDPTVDVEPELIQRLQTLSNQGDTEAAARLISDDLLDRFAFSGSAADLIRQAEALYDAGASRIEFGTPHGLIPAEGIKIIGGEVLPALKRWAQRA